MVNHALCAALTELLQEFIAKVVELESMLRMGTMTIAKLWYNIQPSLDTLSWLRRVLSQVPTILVMQQASALVMIEWLDKVTRENILMPKF